MIDEGSLRNLSLADALRMVRDLGGTAEISRGDWLVRFGDGRPAVRSNYQRKDAPRALVSRIRQEARRRAALRQR